MFDRKILTLVGAVGGTNLLVTILTAVLATGGVAGPTGPTGPAGSSGATGQPGSNGVDGQTPYIGQNGNWFIGTSDTGIAAGGGSAPIQEDENYVAEYDLLTDSLQVGPLAPLAMNTGWEARLRPSFTPISTQAELQAMVDGGAYILTQDIILSTPFTPISYNSGSISIQLNGNNKTIFDLTINGDENSSSALGLFSSLNDSMIFDLTITNATINKNNLYSQAAVLVGQIDNSWIKNVRIEESEVNGIREMGVLAGGISNSEIKGISLSENTLTAISYAGGLANTVTNTLIEDVLVSELVFEPNFAGAKAANITDFQADVGGLIGYASQTIQIDDVTLQYLNLDLINGSYVDGYRYYVYNIGGLIGRINGGQAYDDVQRIHQVNVVNSNIFAGSGAAGFIGKYEDGSLAVTESNVLFTTIYSGTVLDELDTLDATNLTENNFNNLNNYAGGFIAQAYSSGLLFVDTHVNAVIYGAGEVGGYIGYTTGDDYDYEFVYIKNGLSDSDIFVKNSNGGGFGGYWDSINYVVIENSANLSNIDSFYNGYYAYDLGGFVGNFYEIYSFVLISNSYNAGDVVGDYNIGGIVGYNEVEGIDNSVIPNGGLLIYNFYNSGDLYGNDYVGGFVGEQYNQDNLIEIYHSFNAGRLYESDGDDADLDRNYYGAFVAYNESSSSPIRIFNSYYLEQTYQSGDALQVFGYDNSNSLAGSAGGLPISGFITMYLAGSQSATGLAVENLDAFTNANNFYFASYWNFEEAWTFEYTNNGLPTLIHSYRIPA